MEKARKVLLKIMKYLMKPEMRILPGQLAFFLVMSMKKARKYLASNIFISQSHTLNF